MPIATTQDRSTIPSLDEAELIQSQAFNISKIAGVFAAAVAVLAPALGGIPALNDQTDTPVRAAIVAGIFVVLAAAIIGIAWIVVADLRARATVTRANFELRAPTAPSTTAASPAAAPIATLALSAPSAIMAIRTSEDGPYRLVIGMTTSANKDDFSYLVARHGDRPQWIANTDVVDVLFEPAAIAIIPG